MKTLILAVLLLTASGLGFSQHDNDKKDKKHPAQPPGKDPAPVTAPEVPRGDGGTPRPEPPAEEIPAPPPGGDPAPPQPLEPPRGGGGKPRLTLSSDGSPPIEVAPPPPPPPPNIPPCEDHDPAAWHGTWDQSKGCYYEHHHGTNPFSTPFADRVAEWGQLFAGEAHHGFVFLWVEAENGCEKFDEWGEGCVRRALLRVHSTGTIHHLKVRQHSARLIAEVCNQNQTQCGVVETGSIQDYGIVHCPYKEIHCPLTVDPWGDLSGDGDNLSGLEDQPPYKAARTIDLIDRVLENSANPQFWQSLGPNTIMFKFFDDSGGGAYHPTPNQTFKLAWKAHDSWGLVDPMDFATDHPSENHLDAPDFRGGFNHSRFCVFNIRISFPDFVQVGPGFEGWTDRHGAIVENCTQEGVDCHPLKISSSVPQGIRTFSLSRSVMPDCRDTPSQDFDVCFDPNGKVVDCMEGGFSPGWLKPK